MKASPLTVECGAGVGAVVDDVEQWLTKAIELGAPFAEIGCPWGDLAAVHRWTPPSEVKLDAGSK